MTSTGDGLKAIPDRGALKCAYEDRKPGYLKILSGLETRLRVALEKDSLWPIIKGRVKTFDSWYAKRIRLLRIAAASGMVPIPITDVVALRVVCPFLGDLTLAEAAIGASFKVLDVERKGSEHSPSANSATSQSTCSSSYLRICKEAAIGLESTAFEVQLRTILQEAWAEVEHELVYKAEFTPFDEPMKRKLAALNANLSLSDIIFQEILDYQRRLTSELGRGAPPSTARSRTLWTSPSSPRGKARKKSSQRAAPSPVERRPLPTAGGDSRAWTISSSRL